MKHLNITFLIGNGFDRNLGLKTTYSDFVKYYKKTDPKTATLKNFHTYIKENDELWSSAEIAMGKYTGELEKGQAEAFVECQTDFCENLAEYLKDEVRRINFADSDEKVLSAFSRLNSLVQVFPTQERSVLNDIFQKKKNENTVFNFICFNYTLTLDECLNIVQGNMGTLGVHKNGAQVFEHRIGEICHVHGTVDKEMVFGVNDDSQIKKIDVFDCEDGDLYKNLLIKVQTNASYLEDTDTKANRLLQNSNLIYVFGMSFGDTDKLWWDRICTWLSGYHERHLIIQKYDLPVKTVFPSQYQLAERKAKKEITKHSNLDDNKKLEIEKRIHVTNENIFSPISRIAKPTFQEQYLLALEQNENEELYQKYISTLEQIKNEDILDSSKETVQV